MPPSRHTERVPRGLPRPVSWLLLCLLMLSCLPRPAAGQEETRLTVYAQAYTPEITTGDNPRPLHEFTRLARRFEALHPGVRVEFIRSPVGPTGDYRTWLRTQLQGGLAPDIVWAHAEWCNLDAKYGWFVALDPYLGRPNRYIAPGRRGRRRWGDQFYPDATNARRAPDGRLYSLPIDQVETAIYYNIDLFERAGVRPPTTWAEWMEVHRRLAAAGIQPFLMTGAQPMRMIWARRILLDQLWADRLPEMDMRPASASGYPGVDPQELVRAVQLGIFTLRDPRHREYLRLMREWSQYWQPGWLAAQDDRLFRLGGAAMWWDGSWYIPPIRQDPLRGFRWGMFLPPRLTRESSPYAGGDGARGVGGAASIQYAVTQSAVKGDRVELAVDFLRFITAPQNLGPLVSEAELFVPNVLGLEGAPSLRLFMPLLQTGATRFGGEEPSPWYGDQWFRVMQGHLGGELEEGETLRRLERYLRLGADEAVKMHAGEWRWGPDWQILPPAAPTAPPPAPPRDSRPLAAGAAVLLGAAALAAARPAVRRARASYCFLAPTFLLLALFSYYPIASALGHAFTDWHGNGESTWVGLANFRALPADDILAGALRSALILLAAHLVITLTVPLAVAELLFALRSPRAQYLYRVLFVIPMVVPGVVILLIWGFFYDYNLGLLNQALEAVGMGAWKQSWLGDPRIALYSLIGIGFPWVGGFALLIYYAGLQNIPTDVLDSARIDGARGLSRFRFVDLPLLMGQVKLLVVLGFIGGLQGFQTQLLLTNGGPGYSTMVPGLHLYQSAITFDRMGYACAIGVALFLLVLGITYLNLKYLRSGAEFQP